MADNENQNLPPIGDINRSFEQEMAEKNLEAQKSMEQTLTGDSVASDMTLKLHTPLLEDIRRGLDASALTMKERFGRFISNLGGLRPSRAEIKSRHEAESAEVASSERSKDMLGLAKMQLRTNMNIEKALTGNRLADIEARRDAGDRHQKLVDAIVGLQGEEQEEPGFLKKIFQGLFALGLAITAFLVGFKETLFDQIKIIKKFFSGLKIMQRFKGLTNIFAKEGKIGKAIEFIKKIFGKVGQFFTKIKNVFTSIFKLGEKSSKIFAFFKNFGRIIGRFFLPLTVIMGVWETIQGFMKGFNENGIIGGIIGAMDGFLEFFIDAPINMLKDLTSWLLEKLGFENAAASLDAFEFDLSGMVSGVFYTMVNWVRGLFGLGPIGGENEPPTPDEGGWSFTGMLSDVWNNLTSFFTDKFSWETLQEFIAFALEWSLPGLIVKAIEGIYNFFTEKFSWETISTKLSEWWETAGDFATVIFDLISNIWTSVTEWFKENISLENVMGALGEVGSKAMEFLGIGGSDNGEDTAEDDAVKKEKFVDMLKSKVAEQSTQLAELHEESMIQGKIIKELQALLDNTKDANAEGGGVAINNAPVTSSTVNNQSETFSMPLSPNNSDNTFQSLLQRETTVVDW